MISYLCKSQKPLHLQFIDFYVRYSNLRPPVGQGEKYFQNLLLEIFRIPKVT